VRGSAAAGAGAFRARLGTVRRAGARSQWCGARRAALLFVAFQGFTGHSNCRSPPRPIAALLLGADRTDPPPSSSSPRTWMGPARIPARGGGRLEVHPFARGSWRSGIADRRGVGWDAPAHRGQAAAGYTALGSSSLAGLADVYRVYAVARDPAGAPPAWRVVFDNGRSRLKTGSLRGRPDPRWRRRRDAARLL